MKYIRILKYFTHFFSKQKYVVFRLKFPFIYPNKASVLPCALDRISLPLNMLNRKMSMLTFRPFFVALITLILGLFVYQPGQAQSKKFKAKVEKQRAQKAHAFLNNPKGPLDVDGVNALDYFAPSEDYVIKASYTLLPNESSFLMDTYNGETAEYIRYAVLTFQLPGDTTTHRLTAYRSVRLMNDPNYKNHLFLPFKDQSNGIESYGGGRYMDLKDLDFKKGKVELDFNAAYNPYCAYSNGYRCPVPPIENHLNAKVLAGEKAFTGEIRDRVVD